MYITALGSHVDPRVGNTLREPDQSRTNDSFYFCIKEEIPTSITTHFTNMGNIPYNTTAPITYMLVLAVEVSHSPARPMMSSPVDNWLKNRGWPGGGREKERERL